MGNDGLCAETGMRHGIWAARLLLEERLELCGGAIEAPLPLVGMQGGCRWPSKYRGRYREQMTGPAVLQEAEALSYANSRSHKQLYPERVVGTPRT